MSTNALAKAAAARKRAANPYSLGSAIQNGGPVVWLSCLIMGLGNFFAGQIIKGLLFLIIEIGVFVYMFLPEGGLYWLSMLPSLGWRERHEEWSDEVGGYIYVNGDISYQILLFGVVTVAILVMLVVFWRASVRSGYKGLSLKKAGKHVPTFKDDLHSLLDEKIHQLLMTPPALMLGVFTVLPLVYMMAMAFTNYSKEGNHLILFDWVGFNNFISLFSSGSAVGKQFWSVLSWTLIWAFFATFLNFFLGTMMAMLINRPSLKLKNFWRGCLSVTIAVPQFVSLMVIRHMFLEQGIVNEMLRQWGLIAKDASLPFLTNVTWARVLVIIVNLWVGIPYTIMQVTGILKNIPAEQYEAARIDGASAMQQFKNITLPYMFFVMTPYIITQFTGNINNFNVIYLFTRGDPVSVGSTAGATDLLVTWLYKLSVDQMKYNLAAVIGILTFLVLSIVSLVTYRSSGSYKNEEGFK